MTQRQLILRDVEYYFGPVFSLMTGLSAICVTSCLDEPESAAITGPSGYGMICIFYLFFHLVLWIPIGVLTVVFYYFRYRGGQINNDNDIVRSITGYGIGVLFIVSSLFVSDDLFVWLGVVGLSLAVNGIPVLLILGICALGLWHIRKKCIDISSVIKHSQTIYYPTLR